MERIAKLGIDVSINSTGIAIIIPETTEAEETTIFFQVCPGETKVSGSVTLLTYKKTYLDYDKYSDVDCHKIISAENLAQRIHKKLKQIAKIYELDGFDARQEGSVMSSSFKKKLSKINDLTTYNVAVKRMMLASPLVQSVCIIAPNSLKKYATGRGNCNKERMEEVFYEKNPNFHIPLNRNGKHASKNDDIADAWHLATAPVEDELKFYKSK